MSINPSDVIVWTCVAILVSCFTNPGMAILRFFTGFYLFGQSMMALNYWPTHGEALFWHYWETMPWYAWVWIAFVFLTPIFSFLIQLLGVSAVFGTGTLLSRLFNRSDKTPS